MAASLSSLSLNALLAVEVMARQGTLSAAAAELGVTPGAVSQKLLTVERRLGVTLFERTPSGMRLTPLGAEMVTELSQGFTHLSRALAKAGTRTENRLTISAPPVFAARWLIWRLPRFSRAHPEYRVTALAETDHRNPDQSDVDLCIRVGTGPWPDVQSEYLMAQTVFPVCSPELATRLTTPDDLRHVPIIRDSHTLFDWNVWLAGSGVEDADLSDDAIFSDASLCLDAAMTGAGVFLAGTPSRVMRSTPGGWCAPFPMPPPRAAAIGSSPGAPA
ncbi:LysR substrate-binding domain-containing protein [Rhodobacteraceae bacterium D3-12]|nr:LysR substrate-binding domain-containing protein [Rhodobacteraceae bacterium D3-12]